MKIGSFELGDYSNVTVASCLIMLVLFFWYVWKEETPAILWYQLDVSGGFIFKFMGGSNHCSW